MSEPILRSEDFPEGYRLTSTSRGLRIEFLGEGAEPLPLDADQLARFGLKFQHDIYHPAGESSTSSSQGMVDQILGSMDRALALLQNQPEQPARKWDIANLKRARTLLANLNEKYLDEILGQKTS
ncbi:MAG: hypothetical protein V3T54_00170 [Acidobacteriota bacterium]